MWSGNFFSYTPFELGRLFYETLSPALFCSQEAVSRLSYYTIIYAVTANRSWLGCQCFFCKHNILNLRAVRSNCYSREIVRSCQLCSQLTQWKRFDIWPTDFDFGVQQRGHPLYTGRWQSNTADGRMEYMCVTLGCFESTSALNDIPCSMR